MASFFRRNGQDYCMDDDNIEDDDYVYYAENIDKSVISDSSETN